MIFKNCKKLENKNTIGLYSILYLLFIAFVTCEILFIFLNNFIYFNFLAVLRLHCCVGFPLVVVSGRYCLAVVIGLLIAVASPVAEHCSKRVQASVVPARGLSSCRSQALKCKLNSCGPQTLLLQGMWDLPRQGLNPGLLRWQTEPPGKPTWALVFLYVWVFDRSSPHQPVSSLSLGLGPVLLTVIVLRVEETAPHRAGPRHTCGMK